MNEPKKIQDVVAEKISSAGGTVLKNVVDKLADIEIARRVELVIVAIGRIDNLSKELKKINRPDSAHYDGEGKKIETTTEKRFQEIRKAKDSIERIEKALHLALETNTEDAYKKLSESCASQQKQEAKEDAQ